MRRFKGTIVRGAVLKNNMAEFDIVSIGECMVEFYSDKPFMDAEMFYKSYGGDTINLLVAASRLGSRTGYITKVGEDNFAPYFLQGWLNERIDLSLVKVIPGLKNGVYFAAAYDDEGYESAFYRKGSAATTLSVDDINTEYIAAARYFHASGISQAISKSCRSAVYEACRLVAENKTGEVSYNPHYRPDMWSAKEAQSAFQELLPFIDILFLKHPFEPENLFGIADPEKVIRALWQQGVRIVALKVGKKGCIIGEKHSGLIGGVDALKVSKVVDRTGAGDTFAGAFLHGLARKMDVFQAAWLGNIMAGLKTTGHGAIASMPHHDNVYQIFEAV